MHWAVLKGLNKIKGINIRVATYFLLKKLRITKMGRSRDIGRTFDSGAKKRAKQQKQEEFLKKQCGALNKFPGFNLNPIISASSFSIADGDINNDVILLSKNDSFQPLVVDLNDPAYWPQSMTHTTQMQIVERGPIRILDFVFPLQKKSGRKFSIAHYSKTMSNGEIVDRMWLVYSKTADRVFCFVCKLFEPTLNTSLANVGCDDWGHLSHLLKCHERNKHHYINIKKWIELKNRFSLSQTIDKEFLAAFDKEKRHWRGVLTRIIAVIKYLTKHSLAFRGKSDVIFTKNNGNFLGLMEMLSEFDTDIISIKEYFLTFINVHSTTGLNLSNTLKNQLDEYGLKLSNCRGQSYDNGSNMIGLYKGVQSRILQNSPRAFFVPYSAHSLNLVLRDSAKSSTKAITFFGYVGRIFNLFLASTHRWDIFKSHCNLYTVKQWSETRWESRINSVKAIRFQVKNVMHALSKILETSDDPITKSEALSLLNEVGSFEFLLSLIIWYELLTEVNIVSKNFQNPNMQLDVSTNMLKGLIVFLEKYRDNRFEKAMETAKQLAISIEIEPTFNEVRYRKKKRCFSYESVDETLQDPQQNFRTQYFLVILDSAIMSMSKRFNQINNFNSNFGFLYDISKLKTMPDDLQIRKHCQDLHIILTDGEDKDIDAVDLFEELLILREMVDNNMTALQTLKLVKHSLGSFSNVEVALRILLTIPIASAGAERSFSKLKLIKNFLRNSLSQFKLAGLALIAIESEIGDSLSLENILDTFAAQKARKKMF
ncbi:zinc finger MYM-type protein 1-like [Aphis craccivora]|uniref:Zinc finger MYM-type protein 1-like n=1 Tax=Aphis craccivora TaxID=307492 RepID=A0A6G0Y407_APHCR|nr:zinc finger MYM-type protein 1-like [Aphis craccivora]